MRSQRLRLVVDTLPYQTRAAMLEGIKRYDIIAGAYSDRDGGVCPMLAAHRCGGRTNLRGFARAWDRFTGAGGGRRASERELRTLAAQLEASLWAEDQSRYAHSIDSERLVERASATEPEGAAWMMPFRDLEDYARAVRAALEDAEKTVGNSSSRAASREHAVV
jgi:hypothetical protein